VYLIAVCFLNKKGEELLSTATTSGPLQWRRAIFSVCMKRRFKVGYLEELDPLNIKRLLVNVSHQILPDPTKSNTIILIGL
jgi:hypothetical protein